MTGKTVPSGAETERRRAYRTWHNMLRRCLNPKCASWKDYGARGISVCGRWMDVNNFYADMGGRKQGMTIERIDNDGNYEPGNCRWATRAEQSRNKRRSVRLIAAKGKALTIKQWASRIGIRAATLQCRLRSGRPVEECLHKSLPKRRLITQVPQGGRRGRPTLAETQVVEKRIKQDYPHFRPDFQPKPKRQWTRRTKSEAA